jgi:secreted repeat protein with Y-X4-D motif
MRRGVAAAASTRHANRRSRRCHTSGGNGEASRPHGQVTYNGQPLYLLAQDQKPGDINGQGVSAFGALWYVLSSSGNQITSTPAGSGANVSSGGGVGY